MSGEALLRGRYYSQMRKLGMVGVGASVAAGVITYFAHYKRKERSLSAYVSSLTEDELTAIDKRVHKYAGLNYNSEYPNIPMYELTSDEAVEGFEEFQKKLKPWLTFWVAVHKALVEEDPEITQPLATVMIGAYPGEVRPYTTDKQIADVKTAYKQVEKACAAYKKNKGKDVILPGDLDYMK